MPPLAYAPGIVRVVFTGTISGNPWAAVMHSACPSWDGSTFTQSELDATALGWRNAWIANFIPRQSSAVVTLGAVTAQDLTGPTGLQGNAPGSNAGTLGGTALPANAAMAIGWKVAQHYRGGHGRTYLCGLITGDMQNATSWATATLTAVTSAANAFITAVNATFGGRQSQFVILRRTANKVELTTPVPLPVTGVLIDNRIDTMRRRLGKDR